MRAARHRRGTPFQFARRRNATRRDAAPVTAPPFFWSARTAFAPSALPSTRGRANATPISPVDVPGALGASNPEPATEIGRAIVCPGLIDLDALGDLDSGVLAFDNGDKLRMGRLWSEDYLREGSRETYADAEEAFKYRYALTRLVRNGITTALPITSMYYRKWAERYDEFAAVAAIAVELGIRVYTGLCYMSGISYVCRDGTLDRFSDEPRGLQGLSDAVRFIRDFDGSGGGLVRGLLAPGRIETCTPELLSRTATASAELGVPVRLHCCQSVYEFETVRPTPAASNTTATIMATICHSGSR